MKRALATALAVGVMLVLGVSCADGPRPLARVADEAAFIDDRLDAIDALRQAGRAADAVALLERRLSDKDLDIDERLTCLALAARLGPDGSALVPVLIQELASGDADDEHMRLSMAQALAAVGPDDPAAFAAVDAARPEKSGFLTSRWADALAGFGAKSLPLFVDWATSADSGARLLAARALARCGPGAVPALTTLVGDPEYWVSLTASRSLRETGAPAGDVLPALDALLERPDARAIGAALDAAAEFGPDAASLAARVRPFLEHEQQYVRVAAADALFRLTGELDDDRVTAVAEALSSRYVSVNHRAAEALLHFGPRAAAALPEIDSARWRVTRSTRATLYAAIGAMGDAARPRGVEILRSELRGDPEPTPPTREEIYARPVDDVGGCEDLAAAVEAVRGLRAEEAIAELRLVLERYDGPDADVETTHLRRRTLAAISTLSE